MGTVPATLFAAFAALGCAAAETRVDPAAVIAAVGSPDDPEIFYVLTDRLVAKVRAPADPEGPPGAMPALASQRLYGAETIRIDGALRVLARDAAGVYREYVYDLHDLSLIAVIELS